MRHPLLHQILAVVLLASGCAGVAPNWAKLDGGGGDAEAGVSRDTGEPVDKGSADGPACGPSSCPAGCCIAGQVCATGASHTQCGSLGALCVDCTANNPTSTCKSGVCTSCTPTCSGKLCGASDGCGGSCAAGSGCCSPACTGVLCGASDGCGGSCGSGSGCTPPCAYKADSDTLALYTFEGNGSTVADVTGNHDGTIVGSGTQYMGSNTGCGKSLSFPGTTPIAYVEISDSTDWDLVAGSVDFWVRFDGSASGSEGIVSRDASGTTYDGHLTIMRLCNGSLYLRLQDATNSWGQCSDPLSTKTWHHVGVNFGGTAGLQLYIDGALATRTASIICGTDTTTCGDTATKGISGNDNPWVLGAAAWTSDEGLATPVSLPLAGRIDSFRVSKANRSF